jgi:2-phospho-L-lactate guanylyltransferase
MSLWAIVPVKPFLRSKSRLAGVLSPEERAGLSRAFLGHALDVLARVPQVTETLVISRDPEALALARDHRARTVTESGAPDLNAALRRATHVAQSLGAQAVLIVPADLPLLATDDVRQLLAEDGVGPSVVVAPDRREAGTNALYVRPPGLIAYVFGPHSFRRHLAQAERAQARLRVCRLPGIALDVDVPDDLRAYQSVRG